MTSPTPGPVDSRTASDVAASVRKMLSEMPGWPADLPATGPAAALIASFGRYVELVLNRVNRVPERNRLAFLQKLGVPQQHARAARVPLTFTLSAGARADVIVPAGTQVASAPQAGQEPVVFETLRDLTVSAATLEFAFVKDPVQDRFADRRPLLTEAAEPPVAFFGAERLIDHLIYIGHWTFFGARPLDELRVVVDVDEAATDRTPALSWDLVTPGGTVPLTVAEDTSAGLTRSGRIVFRKVPAVDAVSYAGLEMRWLRGRLETPIAGPALAKSITLQRVIEQSGLGPAAGFANRTQLDLTKDFFPFGESPRLSDVFYLVNDAAFSLAHAKVQLKVTLSGSADPAADPIVPAPRIGAARLTWEFWNGSSWQELGTARTTEDVRNEVTEFSDTTRAFTRSGEVRFRFPVQPQPTAVGGVSGYFVRARISSGDFGEPAQYVPGPAPDSSPHYVYKPQTLSPPSLKSIEIGYSLLDMAELPEALFAQNDFVVEDVAPSNRRQKERFQLFRPTEDRRTALYLGFRPAAAMDLPGHPLTLYFSLADDAHRAASVVPISDSPVVVWEYWRGAWSRLPVRDSTSALTCAGAVEALLPSDAEVKLEFGESAYWVRVLWRGQPGDTVSPLRQILINTTAAEQASTIKNEILELRTDTADRVYSASRGNILDAVLEVRETVNARSSDARWVRWEERRDLNSSGPDACHYVLDHASGTVRFGDGQNGRVPPGGPRAVRFSSYRVGGGRRGNLPTHSIVQLRSAIPYLERVTNMLPSSGGTEAEAAEAFAARVATTLRHQDRAVAAEDFEDLALAASGRVARAKCYPLVDLRHDADGRQPAPGTLSVVIVPRSEDPRPLPPLDLLNDVRDFLSARQSATARVVVIAPDYVAVDVDAELVVDAIERASEIELMLRRILTGFLHPVSGGASSRGWDFGRQPHRSDIHARLSSIPGVDHVRRVRLSLREQRSGAIESGRFVVCPGTFTLWYFGR